MTEMKKHIYDESNGLCSVFSYNVDFYLTRIFHFALNFLCYILSKEHCLTVIDLLRFNDNPDFSSRLNRIRLFDAFESRRNGFELFEPFNVIRRRFTSCAGSRAGYCIRSLH